MQEQLEELRALLARYRGLAEAGRAWRDAWRALVRARGEERDETRLRDAQVKFGHASKELLGKVDELERADGTEPIPLPVSPDDEITIKPGGGTCPKCAGPLSLRVARDGTEIGTICGTCGFEWQDPYA